MLRLGWQVSTKTKTNTPNRLGDTPLSSHPGCEGVSFDSCILERQGDFGKRQAVVDQSADGA